MLRVDIVPNDKAVKRNELTRTACSNLDKSPKGNVEKKVGAIYTQYVQYMTLIKVNMQIKTIYCCV